MHIVVFVVKLLRSASAVTAILIYAAHKGRSLHSAHSVCIRLSYNCWKLHKTIR